MFLPETYIKIMIQMAQTVHNKKILTDTKSSHCQFYI